MDYHQQKKIKSLGVRASARIYAAPKRKKWKLFLFVFLFLIIIGGLVYGAFFSPIFLIKDITIIRQENIYYAVSNEEIKQSIEKLLTQKRFLFFSQNNLLVFSESAVKKIVKDRLIFDSLILNRKLNGQIEIKIQDTLPVAILKNESKFFYLDKQGRVLKTVQEKFMDQKLPLLFFKNSIEQNSTDKIAQELTSETINFILQTFQELKNKQGDFRPISYEISFFPDTDIKVLTKNGCFLFFDQRIDINKQLENLNLALEKKLKGKNFDYIDLRYEERLYYKEK